MLSSQDCRGQGPGHLPLHKTLSDRALELAKGAGRYLGSIATAVASPYFSPALLTAGILWILLVGEPAFSAVIPNPHK